MLSVAEPFLQQQMHPTVIISAFRQALEDLVDILRTKIASVFDAFVTETSFTVEPLAGNLNEITGWNVYLLELAFICPVTSSVSATEGNKRCTVQISFASQGKLNSCIFKSIPFGYLVLYTLKLI